MATGTTDPPEQQPPIYWFVILTESLERGEYAAAARAAEQLRSAGIDVRFKQPARKAVAHA